MITPAGRFVVGATLALSLSPAVGQRAPGSAPRARPAITAIVKAFDAYPLVAIGEVHRNEQVHRLIATLVRDPRFLPTGGDIVVEFGNARYQDRVDRYVYGNSVDETSLAAVWRDAVNILVWDAPVYRQFFAAVREANLTRRPASRLRVLLADPAMDWSTIHDGADWERIAATRDRHAADVTEREVLARGHRALLVFGAAHVENENAFGKPSHPRPANLAALLEAEHPGVTLRITSDWMSAELDRRLARLRPPVLLSLRKTWLGDVHLGPPSQTPRLEEIADEFLYLGPRSSLTSSVPAREVYADTVYLRELLRRDTIQGGKNAGELRRLSARFLPSVAP